MPRYTLGEPTASGAPVMLQHRLFGKPVRWVRIGSHWVNGRGQEQYIYISSLNWPAIEYA